MGSLLRYAADEAASGTTRRAHGLKPKMERSYFISFAPSKIESC